MLRFILIPETDCLNARHRAQHLIRRVVIETKRVRAMPPRLLRQLKMRDPIKRRLPPERKDTTTCVKNQPERFVFSITITSSQSLQFKNMKSKTMIVTTYRDGFQSSKSG